MAEEVLRRNAAPSSSSQSPAHGIPTTGAPSQRNKAPAIPDRPRAAFDGHDEAEPHAYDGFGERESGRRLGDPALPTTEAPVSALEHYEEAVRRETQGSLGDSVSLYRKAFKLDSAVQEIYKKKHFPASAFAPPKPTNPNPSNASATVPNTAHQSLAGFSSNITDLISSFASLSIPGEEAPTDLSPPPPCPVAGLPEELLTEILLYVAIDDIAAFARLSQVCKRMAYLVMTEDRIWRRVALGHESGFSGMHYRWACKLDGAALGDDGEGGRLLSSHTGSSDPEDEGAAETAKFAETALHTLPLVPDRYPTFRTLVRTRPRIRFNGCYISTVNYTRPGGQQSNTLSWTSPVLIVTYYRYLRFFRDGSCVSLLTTSEPHDVVPYLAKENMYGQNGAHAHSALPQAVMKDALPGRWRLSRPAHPVDPLFAPPSPVPDHGATAPPLASTAAGAGAGTSALYHPATDHSLESEPEGMLHVETAGVIPKYIYRMVMELCSAGKHAPRNNKLAWQGYWSYNRLTDDWAEFGLKNDKPYYWSRVKSWR